MLELCFISVVLLVVILVGHGLWIVVAAALRALFGVHPRPVKSVPCPDCGRSIASLGERCFCCGYDPDNSVEQTRADLAITLRQLRRFFRAGSIDEKTFEALRGQIIAERERLNGVPVPRTVPVRETPQTLTASQAQAEPITLAVAEAPPAAEEAIAELAPPIDEVPAPEPRPEPEPPRPVVATHEPEPRPSLAAVVILSEPPVAPRPPRQPFRAMLTAFMEERNILWGELVGGVLIVGCSIALVVSLWPTLGKIPYSPFLIFAAITAALFGSGLYTLHHWKLASTSRGLLGIASLLVPLNFLVMAGLHVPDTGYLEGGLQVLLLAIFAWLVWKAGQVLVPPGGWLLPVGVVGCAAVELLAWWLLPAGKSLAWALALGLAAVACQSSSVGGLLWRMRKENEEGPGAGRLLLHLGIVSFAVFVTLGFLGYGTEQVQELSGLGSVLEHLALVVALAGVPVLLAGFRVHTVLADRSDAGGMRTAGTAVALTGAAILVAALALAWPQPWAVCSVGIVDFIVLTVVAVCCRFPVAHAAAVPCLVLALITGTLTVWQGAGPDTLTPLLWSAESGIICAGLFLLLGVSAEWLARRGRRIDAGYYAVGAIVPAILGLALVSVPDRGIDHPVRAMLVYLVCAGATLAFNSRWRRPVVASVNLAVVVGATLWALFAAAARLSWLPSWEAVLAAESALMAGLAALFGWRGNVAEPETGPQRRFDYLLEPLARSSAGLAALVSASSLWVGIQVGEWSGAHILTGAGLCTALLLLAGTERSGILARAAGLMLSGTAAAGAGWLAISILHADGDLFPALALALSLAACVMAAIAVASCSIGESSSPWYSVLSNAWRDSAIFSGVVALVLIGLSWGSGTPWLAATALAFVAWTAFCVALRHRQTGWTWVGSFLALAGLVRLCPAEDLAGFLREPGLALALLAHASLALMAAAGLRVMRARRPAAGDDQSDRVFVAPLVQAGLLSSVLALVQTFVADWPTGWASSECLFWSAGLWLWLALWRRSQAVFGVFEAVLCAAVVYGTRAWLASQSWAMQDIRTLQIYGIALAGLTLVWTLLRLASSTPVSSNEHPESVAQRFAFLLWPSWPAVDQVLLAALVLGQAALTIAGIVPPIVRELASGGLLAAVPERETALLAGGFGGSAWVLLGLVTLALVVSLLHRDPHGNAILGLTFVAVTAAVLAAGPFAADHAANVALRWNLAGCFVLCSAGLLWRQRLTLVAGHLGCRLPSAPNVAEVCRAILVVGTVLPILGLTWAVAAILFAGGQPEAPLTGTFYDELNWLVRLGVPLILVATGLVGHAIRERSPGYAFAAGLVVNVTVTGGYALVRRGEIPAAPFVTHLGQLATVTFAAWALVWSSCRWQLRRRWPWSDSPLAAPLMELQRRLAVTGNAVLLIGALALLIAKIPGTEAWPAEAGSGLGWLALLSTGAACAWQAIQERRAMGLQNLGLFGMACVGLLACSMEAYQPGFGYRALMLGSGAFGLGWAWSAWQLGRNRATDADRDFVRALRAATDLWVTVAASLAVALALKSAFSGGDLLWAAGALALASPAAAIVAVWRHREPWASAAGLAAHLAASFVTWHFLRRFHVPASEAWIDLIEANAVAGAAIAALWLWLRSRLYGPGMLRLRSSPLLAVHVGGSVLLAASLLVSATCWLIGHPGSDWPTDLAKIGHAGGWLAWFLAMAVAAWYASQVGPRGVVHALAVFLVGMGVLDACLDSRFSQQSWRSYHELMFCWAATGFGLLGLGWRLTLPRTPGQASADPLQLGLSSRGWAMALGGTVAVLALRAAWSDPGRPYVPIVAALAGSSLFGLVALWKPGPGPVYVSALLINLAGFCGWVAWGNGKIDNAVFTQAVCCAAGAILWTALERLGQAKALRWTWPALSHLMAAVAMLIMTVSISVAVTTSLMGRMSWAGTPLGWIALAGTAMALAILTLDSTALFAGPGLYVVGLLGLGLALHTADLTPEQFGWWAGIGLSMYGLMATGVERTLGSRSRGWFLPAQAVSAMVVIGVSIWAALALDGRAERLGGSLAVVLLLMSGVGVAGAQTGRLGAWIRSVVLALGVLGAVEFGVALIDPALYATAGLWLRRDIAAMVALAVMTILYGVLLNRRLPWPEWGGLCRRLGPILGLAGSALLVTVLAQEAWLYRFGTTVPTELALSPLAVALVLIALVALFVAGLTFAVLPDTDPFGLSERGRTAYVYVAEVLLALMFVHMRLTVPQLFHLHIFAGYWPFIVMGLAFVGAGLGEFFERRHWRVLAEPVERTGIGLPLLPALAFWLVPAERYAMVWLMAGLLYALISVSRRSFRFALVAALSANAGLWVLLHHHQVYLWRHPQLWLIPPALVALVAEHLNRDRLGHYQSMTLRYLALAAIYVSSTADLFIAGLGNGWLLPLVLIVLCVAGILLGMMLRVRALLLLGSVFLVLTIALMIWHAGVDGRQPWILWASGVVLGAAIVALFGVFEKRRDDVLRLVEDLKEWK